MSKNHIDLSIIIPTLGRNDSLARCLDSIFHLNWEPYSVEVLVICNPPQDQIQRQVEIRNEFGFSLQYVAMKSKGANRSRNRGADLAQGKTLLFLDDDVSLLSNQFMSNFGIHSGEGRGLASGWGGYYFNSPNAGMASKIYNAAANMWLVKSRFDERRIPMLLGGCLLIEKLTFQRLGGFEESAVGSSEERLLCEKLWELGLSTRLSHELSVFHYFQGGLSTLFAKAFRHGYSQRSEENWNRPLSFFNTLKILNKTITISGENWRIWRMYPLLIGLICYYFALKLGAWASLWTSFRERKSAAKFEPTLTLRRFKL